MNFYTAKNKPMPWGDCGQILLEGFSYKLNNSRVAIERAGPFAPPIVISSGRLIATDSVKRALQTLGLRGVSFRKCVKQKIVDIPWTDWDPLKEPPRYPAGGEPENYILRRKHNERLAGLMPDLWELAVPEGGANVGRVSGCKSAKLILFENTWNKADAFRVKKHPSWIFFTQRARDEIRRLAGGYLRFRRFKSEVASDAELAAKAQPSVTWWERASSVENPPHLERQKFSELVKKANRKVKDACQAKTDQGRSSRYASAYGYYQAARKIMPFDSETQRNLETVLFYFGYLKRH